MLAMVLPEDSMPDPIRPAIPGFFAEDVWLPDVDGSSTPERVVDDWSLGYEPGSDSLASRYDSDFSAGSVVLVVRLWA